jgi:hypothetical protein
LEQLNIAEYLVRTSNLEEVFTQIGEDEKKKQQQHEITFDSEAERKDSLLPEHSRMLQKKASMDRAELGASSKWRILNTYLQLNCRTRMIESCIGCCMMVTFMSISLITLHLLTLF